MPTEDLVIRTGLVDPVIISACHKESNGVNGQTLTLGARRILTLNTLLVDTESTSISSSAIQSVPSGYYQVTAWVATGDTLNSGSGSIKQELYITDNSSDLAVLQAVRVGSLMGKYSGTGAGTIKVVLNKFAGYMHLPASTNIQFEYYPIDTDQPLAYAAGSEEEYYHNIELIKIRDI